MDANEEAVPSTARLNFGQKVVAEDNTEANVQAEKAQQEAMTAEAEETPVETTEASVEASTVEAEAQTETSEAEPVDAPEAPVEQELPVEENTYPDDRAYTQAQEVIPVPDDNEGLVDAINDDAAHQAYRQSEVEAQTTDVLAEADTEDGNTADPYEGSTEDAAVTEAGDTAPVDTATLEVAEPVTEVDAVEETQAELAVEPTADVETIRDKTDEAPAAPEISPVEPTDEESVEELQAKREALDNEIKSRTDAQKASVLAQIKTVVETFKITTEEVVKALGGLKLKRKGVPAKPKYKDPASGMIWSGRGKEPAWIKGQDRNKFLIA